MASLFDIQTQFAVVLSAISASREIVQGRRGEGPEPGAPFAMWQSDVALLANRPTTSYPELGVHRVAQLSRVEFAVSFDGADAFADAQAFCLSWWSPDRYKDIFHLCGFMGVDGPRDLSAPQLARYQTRADCRVILSAELSYDSVPEFVDHSCITVINDPHEYADTICVERGVDPHGCG